MNGPIRYTTEGGIAHIVLDRPTAGNSIDLALARGLLEAAIAADTDPTVRCVVMTGAGRLFCAGGDIGLMVDAGAELPAVITELITALHAAVARLAGMRKPLLTLINGPAAGAGMSLALLGDVVLCGRSAHFTAAYGAIGLTADGGLSWLLPRLVGLRKAQEIILTNCRIKAEEAKTIGLVTRVVEDEALVDEGAQIAMCLAAAPTAAFGAARMLLAHSFETGLANQLDLELRSMAIAAAGEAQEGIAAFIEKRAPEFYKDTTPWPKPIS